MSACQELESEIPLLVPKNSKQYNTKGKKMS